MSTESTARKLSKAVIGGVVGLGTSTIVRQTIANNTSKSGIGYITIPIAGLVIGLMASDATKKYVDNAIDSAFDQLEELGIIEISETPI